MHNQYLAAGGLYAKIKTIMPTTGLKVLTARAVLTALSLVALFGLPALSSAQGALPPKCHTFKGNLQIGYFGGDVAALQRFLGLEGFSTKNDRLRSYFGEETASAVTGFQTKYNGEILAPSGLQYGTGHVGQYTRAKLNSLYGCVVTPNTIITVLAIPMRFHPPDLGATSTP